MPIECLISFDNNPQGVYYAGQELSGIVDLSVDATKRVKGIHVTVSGYAKIRWIKKGYPRDSERAMCRAYRSYLSSRSYVLGTCASNSCMDWPAGDYSYTFHVILPENLPTSFDGKYGQIHYEIITTIERPARYPKVFKLPFTVIQPLDLNADALYRVPLEILDRKRFWSFCCPTGPLTVKFSTPYCGYAPGQKIHFVLYINNESSIDITACEVKLKQEVTYESHDPQHEYRYDKHLIARKQFGNVLRWSRKVYRGYLDLPSIPPTSVKPTCPISVNYSIKIIVNPTEFHWKMKLKIPLTIGSIPIMDSPEALLRFNQQQQQHHVVSENLQITSSALTARPRTTVNNLSGSAAAAAAATATAAAAILACEQRQIHNQQQQQQQQQMQRHQQHNNNNTIERLHSTRQPQHQQQQTHAQRLVSATLPTMTLTSASSTTSSSTPTGAALMPAILVTDSDNPPDYIPMMPPSYEDAMALSEKFYDDVDYLATVSMSSIMSSTQETLYDESNTQLRVALQTETAIEETDVLHKATTGSASTTATAAAAIEVATATTTTMSAAVTMRSTATASNFVVSILRNDKK